MNELFLTGVGALAILASWRFMFVVSLRDKARDRLGSIRHGIDTFFDKHGVASAEAARVRRSLTSLLDAEIRQLEQISLVDVVSFKVWADENPEAEKALSQEIEAKFATNDERVAAFAKSIRKASAAAIADYISKKYLTIWILAIISLPAVVLHQGWKKGSIMLNQAIREVMARGASTFKSSGNGGVQQSIEETFFRLIR
ncbi:hypothetical protein [Burkholderia cepacia]|uniref:hypothetical protein n=1 Tax=Burkholderia cepacia TaxID=292 RepID=UPI0012D8DFBC|nr:hypothetical protein [Burkholderia cepacia]